MGNELRALIGEKEKILYSGRPSRGSMVVGCIFNRHLVQAVVLAAIIWRFAPEVIAGTPWMRAIPAMPLMFSLAGAIYLGGVFLAFLRFQNLSYFITDKAIYRSEGALRKRYLTKPFAELSHVDLSRGIFDQLLGVGDVVVTSPQPDPGPYEQPHDPGIVIEGVADYRKAYNLVKKLQEDIHADVRYPNDLRPAKNHGRRAKQRG